MLIKNLMVFLTACSFIFFVPQAYAFQEKEENEKSEQAQKDESCEAQITRENEAQGHEMTENEFAKAVKKCEKKKKSKDKPKCQPTGSRLSRC